MPCHSRPSRSNQPDFAAMIKLLRLIYEQGVGRVHCTTPKHSIDTSVIDQQEADLPQLLAEVRKEQGHRMRSTSLDMNSWIFCFQQSSSLLDVASTIKKYTIDTSAKWIKLHNPWSEKTCNECRILFATLNKMVGTCVCRQEQTTTTIGECAE